MGKKKIIKKTEEEQIKETEKLQETIDKGVQVKAAPAARITEGRIYIYSTYNNTIVTLTDPNGNVLAAASSGKIGFKGSKKSTPYAASKVAEALVQAAQKIGITKVRVIIKGVGAGRDSALRFLASRGLEITSVKDVTPIPHGGVRPPKRRRV